MGANLTGVTGHRVRIVWMGKHVETLDDLFPDRVRAVCVGINPAPVSVAAGHYFQGALGQRFFARLRDAGVIGETARGAEDDAAVVAGIGFTDVVKRPTARAAEMAHAVRLLRATLERVQPPVLIFPFKQAAVRLVGPFAGNG